MFSPLDQFKIAPLIKIQLLGIDISITNFVLVSFLTLVVVQSFVFLTKNNVNNAFFIVSNVSQNVLEKLYRLVTQLLFDIITTGSEKYFPFVVVLFGFILTNNLIGMVPYSFTITSHIILTFFISFSIFVAVNIIGFKKHGIKLFSLFLPANTSIFLAFLLVPIELISYIAKPISLGVRLFINLMAGHSLLKVIVGFSWKILLLENFKSFICIFPLLILILLMGLEFSVALIQAYVFITLTSIYLNDVEALH